MLFFITLFGLVLRLTFINKPEGLWNDEYVSWFVSSVPFSRGFWGEILKQCHMPFYYLYLKPFAHCSDLVLRLTSVLPGIIAIPIMYLAGKEYSKKTGFFAATITSVLSFLVYYSQEVRFYSILFLFSALSLLFTIRYVKNSNKKNLFGYIISNVLILATHVLGVIYVFFNLIYVIYKKKKISRPVILSLFILIPMITFFGINILRMLPASQWWGHFTYTNILFLFSDFLSPILTNNVNAPPVFFYEKQLAFWLTIPTVIGFMGYLLGLRKTLSLNILVFMTILIMSLLALSGNLVFITKYAMEVLPIIILTAAVGFAETKKFGIILFTLFITLHLASFFTPYYVTKQIRTEGHRIVGEILNNYNPQNIIFTYYEPERFLRYTDLRGKHTYSIYKNNRVDYIDNPAKIFDNIPNGENVAVVFLDSVSFFDEDFVNINKDNPKIPEMFLTFSHIKNSLIKALNDGFTDFKLSKIGAWTVIYATKK